MDNEMRNEDLSLQLPLDCGDGLVLRFARPEDIDNILQLSNRLFGDNGSVLLADLLSNHNPTGNIGDFTVVENQKATRIVSYMCLISQIWSYRNIRFPCGVPEFVATDPSYRRRGLVRKQFDVIHDLSASRGELMQVIQGIPWFYQQFGYDKALRGGGSFRMLVSDIPALKEGATEQYSIRRADANDHSFIIQLYNQIHESRLFSALRSAGQWDFEFNGRSVGSRYRREWLIIESTDHQAVGYVIPEITGDSIHISIEVKPGIGYLSLMPPVLRGLIKHSCDLFDTESEIRVIYLGVGESHPAYQALPNELFVKSAKAFYVRIPNIKAFLNHVRPALEHNLLGTVAEGYSGEAALNFFTSGVHLTFENGRLLSIADWMPESTWDGDARFPDLTFLQLLCGRRRFTELATIADVKVSAETAILLDCLFPSFREGVWIFK